MIDNISLAFFADTLSTIREIQSTQGLLFDLTLALTGGFLGALVARALRLPLLVGYLLAGVVMGPSIMGLIRDSEHITSIAELGVALLMFALGVELSLRNLTRMKEVTIFAAPLQILLSIAVGQGLGMLLGWPPNQALVLGFVLALSSTMVVVKLLSERGELHTQHGRVMVAMLLVQDLAAVVMVGLLPMLHGLEARDYIEVSKTIGKGAIFVGWTVVMARWIAPALMAVVVRSYSKEIFVAMAAVLCFGGAASSYLLGFSLAMGAFVAGLVVSESRYSHEVLANVTPMRDLFGLVFFVSLGLLFDGRQVLVHPGWILSLLAIIFIGKALIVTVSILLARYHARTAIISGLGLAQIGEFSFLIVILALRVGLISEEIHSLIIGAAVISFLASPALMSLGTIIYSRVRSWRAGDAALVEEEFSRGKMRPPTMEGHVILCGYGRVGSHIGEMLVEEKQPFLVIEYDHHIVSELHKRDLPVLYGDSTSRLLLQAAGAEKARLAVIALPDAISTRLTVRELRRITPDLPIVARVHLSEELEPTCAEGAHEVVQAEFEASLELIRHSLVRLGRDAGRVQDRVDAIRRQRYEKLRGEECYRG